jgi:alkyl hydroperoxide reductase subunit AhpC
MYEMMVPAIAWTEQPRNKGGIGRVSYPIIADVKHTLTFDYGIHPAVPPMASYV